MSSFRAVSSPNQVTYEIKKSLFHGFCAPCEDRQQAMQWLQTQQQAYPDARHHCWAYLIGPAHQPITLACNDDGEPSGTAGKPMLNVLQHGELGNVVIIISRYFGGTKLGAGGLVRAYSKTSALVLENVASVEHVVHLQYYLQCDFKDEQYVRHWCAQHNSKVVHCDYAQTVKMQLLVPEIYTKVLNEQMRALGFELRCIED